MSRLASSLLALVHVLYSVLICLTTVRQNIFHHDPKPLHAQRRQLPANLALLLVSEHEEEAELAKDTILESVEQVVEWCRAVGIGNLTVYERHGVLLKHSQQLRNRLFPQVDERDVNVTDSEMEYPLTPPPSDHSDSRSLSPDGLSEVVTMHISGDDERRGGAQAKKTSALKRRRFEASEHTSAAYKKSLTVQLMSRTASKPAVAEAARALARPYSQFRLSPILHGSTEVKVSGLALDMALEDILGIISPNLMIVHHTRIANHGQNSLELHGFPPWHISLTEIYYNNPRSPSRSRAGWIWPSAGQPNSDVASLTEEAFRRALDQFDAADMRHGK